jgi:hypothetical protein
MFNVMVTAGDNASEEGVYVWDRSRILEYTDQAIREPLKSLSSAALAELAKLPTLFMYERHAEGKARVGAIRRVQQRGSEIRVIFEFNDNIGPITQEQIKAAQWGLGLAEFEFTRTHWAVKSGDLHAILRNAGLMPQAASAVAATNVGTETPPSVDVTPAKVFWSTVGTKRKNMQWLASWSAVSELTLLSSVSAQTAGARY